MLSVTSGEFNQGKEGGPVRLVPSLSVSRRRDNAQNLGGKEHA